MVITYSPKQALQTGNANSFMVRGDHLLNYRFNWALVILELMSLAKI